MLSVVEQSREMLRFRVNSNPALLGESRRKVETFASESGFDERSVAEIGLCVNEAMSNVIRYAYGNKTDGPMEISVRVDPRQLEVSVRDWGCGHDPSGKLRAQERDVTRPGGLGLVCLKSLMSEVKFTPQEHGMLLTLVRRR